MVLSVENEQQPLLNGCGNRSYLTASHSSDTRPDVRMTVVEATKLQKIVYAWQNLDVFVEENSSHKKKWWQCCTSDDDDSVSKSSRKYIIRNAFGEIRPGELLAVMGVSGAGKSTLMNVLTFRHGENVHVTGNRLVNGVPAGPYTLTSNSGYVQQNDIFIGTLTVREQLTFQALVRMDRHIPRKERMARVEEVMSELGLTKCADTIIGVPGQLKGISGGETKRLGFACEVLTDPALLFCDEPTSGLDSFMAQNVVQVLNNLARKGKTVMCTIHQPSSDVYALFDRILLIAEGRVAYMGDTKDALYFFQSQGLLCPMNYNPADYFIEQLAIKPGQEIESRSKVEAICDAFQESKYGVKIQRSAAKTVLVDEEHLAELEIALRGQSPYKATWWAQFRAVLWRSWVSIIKEPKVVHVRFLQTILVSLLLGVIYFDQKLNQEGIMNINGALFLVITNNTFQNMFSVINVFCLELPVFRREHFNGMYRADVYFLSKTIADIPVYTAVPVLVSCISYYMVGFNADISRFFIFIAVNILLTYVVISFGYVISCVSSNLTMAMSIGPPLIIPFMLFGGFFLNNGTVPVYFIWLRYLSWFLYSYEALTTVQWIGVEHIACKNSTVSCIPDGETVLETLDFDPNNFHIDILALVGLMVFFRILAFLALLSKVRRKG